jgi:hypothetical protein
MRSENTTRGRLPVATRQKPSAAVIRAAAPTFWKFVERAATGCWEWAGKTRTKDGAGYWLFSYEGRRYRIAAHRAALVVNGVELDEHDVVFRKCRRPLCVNPEHLGVGDHEDNVAARGNAGNTARGGDNGRAKLTEGMVAEIKAALQRGAARADLARHYEVDRRAIWGIENGRTWKHVEPSTS